MTIRCTVRVMTAAGELLAWADVDGETRGDGAVWALAPFVAVAERAGMATIVDVHWPDLHVHFSTSIDSRPIARGEQVKWDWPGPMFTILGDAGALPAVTVMRSVTIDVPTGGVGVQG